MDRKVIRHRIALVSSRSRGVPTTVGFLVANASHIIECMLPPLDVDEKSRGKRVLRIDSYWELIFPQAWLTDIMLKDSSRSMPGIGKASSNLPKVVAQMSPLISKLPELVMSLVSKSAR